LDVEVAPGDLRDPESLERAVAGCGVVFHIAADYRLWAKDPNDLYRSNVEGTRNLLAAARKCGVERVVYTSTVGCIAIPTDGLGREDVAARLEDMTGAYKRSKFQAEKVALEFAESGFPVVIVNPTAPIGDHDFKPTPTGKIVVDYLKPAGLRARPAGGTIYPRFGKFDVAANSGAARGYRRWPSTALADSACGGLCGRSGKHRLGQSHRTGTAGTVGCRENGSYQGFRFARQGEARAGIQSRARGWRTPARRGLVPGERLRLIVGFCRG
jgi:hypothetical protein